ncbi:MULTISPECIES: hypothetical protein [Bradyrhizobium]|nr:hypothetical protein [Bradyrhizobium diazoefficiens]MBP1060479.1 hypothetical protein [Bradyrhizobium japonicum]AND86555.1 hypothetical protein AAV28_00970 [Bradyrhizobium diazoefficiens USDA 110]AWO87966.2 hypothetical protein DI395_04935 [Bradyrhizobium diazoefficiens]QLD39519.1 hypothetical protein HUW42_00025 [Bradyrhizobium diazoefficiens]WLA73660.1 hypothetical protein QIH77_00025 [Bradyrhizobium diazoefficiens]
MRTVRPGAQAPARWRAFACGLALLASCMLAATAGAFVPDLPRLFSAELTPDPEAKLPAPTRYSYRGTHTTVVQGVKAPLRIRLEATVPAELGNVLAFYRTELSKLGWQEQRDGAVIAADHVQLAFASPLGPALLELHRKDSSTTVKLVQKNALVATDANVMPEPGQAKLVFANISKTDATLTINEQTIKRAAGAHAVSLDLQPGKYSYEMSVPGHPATTNVLDVAVGDTWELTVGPDGDAWSPLLLY